MSAREIVVLDDADQVAAAGAERFTAACERAIAKNGARGTFRVALAGGSTPRAMYVKLTGSPFCERIDWARVEIFFGDERCVPPDHADSNFRMAREALLDHVPLDAKHVHRVEGEKDPEAAARAYEAILPERIDLVLLGMGPDGHTASLFPGTPAIAERARRAMAVYVEKLKSWRVTLTAPVLSAAEEVVVMTVGDEKADALALALEGPDGAVPIQLVKPRRMTWLIDRAAAKKLARV
ncbi:MAG TPA: 6-phosphogluconolactonase [Polyangia bacterium]|nr:6-phosphogluconolactonase [Polyangia bacterium]